MKKKLFAVAVVVSFYVLFVLAYTGIDNHGTATQMLSDFDLSSGAAIASTALNQTGSSPDMEIKAAFRDPMPPPLKKPKPRRKKRKRR